MRTASSEANVLAFASLALLLVKAVVLNRIPSPFAWVYDLGPLVDAVLTSVVASYVFYFLVVHLHAEADRAAVQPYVRLHAGRVVGLCRAQLSDLARTSNVTLDLDTLTGEQVADVFGKLPIGPAPMVVATSLGRVDWLQYFDHHVARTRDSIARVLTQLIYVDARLVALLVQIDDCSHCNWIPGLRGARLNNAHLGPWAGTFFTYCEFCRRLDRFLADVGPPARDVAP